MRATLDRPVKDEVEWGSIFLILTHSSPFNVYSGSDPSNFLEWDTDTKVMNNSGKTVYVRSPL